MSKNKNNKPVWSTRINQKAASTFQKVGSSLNVDKRLFREDITASIAHVAVSYTHLTLPTKRIV